MSEIAGMCRFDRQPVDSSWLARVGFRCCPDRSGEAIATDGSVGMVHHAYYTTVESHRETQPLISRDGQLLACDGRIDNRDELIKRFRDELTGQVSDAHIIMAAYRNLGVAFLPSLIGEFAFSLYDPRHGVLLLGRDHIGARTLYVHWNRERIIWSSEVEVLMEIAGIDRRVEDEYVAGHLTRGPELGVTPYRNVHSVKPAHLFTVTREGRVNERRYWGLDPNKSIHYTRDEEYEDQFNYLFREAVACAIRRADRPVFSEASGGLDSSSIVCVADELLASGEVSTPGIETVSQVFNESPRSDEREFIRYLEEQRKRPGHYLTEEDNHIFALQDPKSSNLALNPIVCFAGYHRALMKLMDESGARVLLSGQGGDEIMGNLLDPSPELIDLLLQRQFRQLCNRIQAWGKALKEPYVHLLLRRTLQPLLPRAIQKLLKSEHTKGVPSWIADDFTQRMHLGDRMQPANDPFGFHSESGRARALAYLLVVKNISAGHRREIANAEVSYPYLHRPLVEFMQAIPYEQLVRPNETRSLQRRALRHVVPQKILRRRGKGSPHQALFRSMAREWPRLSALFVDARVVRLGYVNPEKFSAALDRARHGCEKNVAGLVQTISLEFWLRSLEFRASPAGSNVSPLRETSPVSYQWERKQPVWAAR